jgi:hypothetical protein
VLTPRSRNRKIRCDGARPICHNCSKRAAEREKAHEEPEPECSYDPVPKRRGPDREPGARQRIGRRDSDLGPTRRRRRRPDDHAPYHKDAHIVLPTVSIPPVLPSPPPRLQLEIPPQAATVAYHQPISAPSSLISPSSSRHVPPSTSTSLTSAASLYTPTAYDTSPNSQPFTSGIAPTPIFPISPPNDVRYMRTTEPSYYPVEHIDYSLPTTSIVAYEEEDSADQNQRAAYGGHQAVSSSVAYDPSLNYARETWWDALLQLYHAPEHFHRTAGLPAMTPSQRDAAAAQVTYDLRFIFKVSNAWFSFLNLPRFFGSYCNPSSRTRMQPSLVLGLLAVATLFQSSEVRKGQKGREKALRLRDEAQSALEMSMNAGWLDVTLVQAAWVSAFLADS